MIYTCFFISSLMKDSNHSNRAELILKACLYLPSSSSSISSYKRLFSGLRRIQSLTQYLLFLAVASSRSSCSSSSIREEMSWSWPNWWWRTDSSSIMKDALGVKKHRHADKMILLFQAESTFLLPRVCIHRRL